MHDGTPQLGKDSIRSHDHETAFVSQNETLGQKFLKGLSKDTISPLILFRNGHEATFDASMKLDDAEAAILCSDDCEWSGLVFKADVETFRDYVVALGSPSVAVASQQDIALVYLFEQPLLESDGLALESIVLEKTGRLPFDQMVPIPGCGADFARDEDEERAGVGYARFERKALFERLISLPDVRPALINPNDTFVDDWKAPPVEGNSHVGETVHESLKLNDAYLPEGYPSDLLLDQKITIGLAHSREAKRWPAKEMAVRDFISMLSVHKPGKKDGTAFLQGEAIKNERKARAIKGLYVVGLDVDSGIKLEWVLARLKEMDLFSILYTTHSHLSDETAILQSSFQKWAKKKGIEIDPTRETMRQYVRDEKSWENWVVDTIEIEEEPRHDVDGLVYILHHDPIPKFRIVFVLREPYIISKQGLSQSDAIDRWKGKLLGLSKMIGLPIDESCLDPSRLFYLPRHKEDRAFQIVFSAGQALAFDKVTEVKRVRGSELVSDDVFSKAAADLGASGQSDIEIPGYSLKTWAKNNAARFDIAKLFIDKAPERIRAEVSNEKLEVECPFDDSHSNAGDPEDRAGWVLSAHADGPDSTFMWGCQHASCKRRDRLAFVAKAVNEGWFTTHDLDDPSNMIFTIDESDPTLRVDHSEKADPRAERAARRSVWPAQFKERNGKIWFVERIDDNTTHEEEVCAAFRVESQSFDEFDNDWHITLSFDGPRGTRQVSVSMGQLHGNPKELRAHLMKLGLRIVASRKAREGFDLLVSKLEPSVRILKATRAGWHEWNGRVVYLSPTGEARDAVGPCSDVQLTESARMKRSQPKGTFEAWCAAIEAASEARHWLWPVTLCTGLGGALIALLEMSTMGINFYGDTTKGKTTGQKLAASLYGSTALGSGLLHAMNTTPNAIENLVARSHASAFLGDELKLVKPEHLASTIFAVSGGASKARQKSDSSLREGLEWRTLWVTTSERAAQHIIQSTGENALRGGDVRLIDINVSDMPFVHQSIRDTMAAVDANYGHAWPRLIDLMFARGYVADREKLRAEVTTLADYLCDGENDGPRHRAATTLAIVWKAGQIMIEAGIPVVLGTDVSSRKMALEVAMKAAWAASLIMSDDAILDSAQQNIGRVRSAFQRNLDARFIRREPIGEATGFARADVWGWYDETTIYIPRVALGEITSEDHSIVAKRLADAGLLVRRKSGHLYHEKIPQRGKEPHYRLRRKELIGDDVEVFPDAEE